MIENLRKLIEKDHEGDSKQLEVIFSNKQRLLVEAPAGCGKTKTMISKIAYILASNQLPKNKKILALTFSVNAAYKIKKDVAEKLPLMGINGINEPSTINKRMFISNYHGFARRILNRYGFLIHPNLSNINTMKSIDDSKIKELTELGINLSLSEAEDISRFSEAVKNLDIDFLNKNFSDYVQKILQKFLPKNLIPYNAYLILLKKLFDENKELKKFYQKVYPFIIIDEFQDTNILSMAIVKQLIDENTTLVFMGDPLQRIYGFIGAIPNLMSIVEKKYSLHSIFLDKNYRFRNNPNMIYLDRNIRENTCYSKPNIENIAKLPFYYFENQEKEAKWVIEKINQLKNIDPTAKIAILAYTRNRNLNVIIEELNKNNINFFYALFTEDDKKYVTFHQDCLEIIFNTYLKLKNKRINISFLNSVIAKIKKQYENNNDEIITSLLKLVKVFFENLNSKYSILNDEDKFSFLIDTFENRSLKQNMEFIEDDVIVSTVHGAKGLEWQYVILPDMEQCVFPSYYSLCEVCRNKYNMVDDCFCKINMENTEKGSPFEKMFLDVLSVFYVAVTRAKKQVFLSASSYGVNSYGEKKALISCLLSLPGIKIEFQ